MVVNMMMPKIGTNNGPFIQMRFKITKSGDTDWIGMVMGGRAIDHPIRG